MKLTVFRDLEPPDEVLAVITYLSRYFVISDVFETP